MILTPLYSQHLASAGYDEPKRLLEIHFRNGVTYLYHEVPKDVFDNLLKSASPGSYFTAAIKHVYQWVCVGNRGKQ
jgi:lysyl-tRNA synthetase, class II